MSDSISTRGKMCKTKEFALAPPPAPTEAEVQRAVLKYLEIDARVAWAHRFNVGAQVFENMDRKGRMNRQFVRFAFKGCSDILGQMTDGRFLAVEVKGARGKVSADQQRFLDVVHENNGIAIIARSVIDVMKGLDDAD